MFMLFAILLLGPRFGILVWWLAEPGRWDSTFSSYVFPFLGVIFLPWSTLMFVVVAPMGRVNDADWILLAFAFFIDLLSYAKPWASGRRY